MPNFISEDDIEKAMLQRLQHVYGYDVLNCFTTDPSDLNDGSGRTDKREVILRDRLREAVIDLNPEIPESAIDDALKQLCDKRQILSTIAANREKSITSFVTGCGSNSRTPRAKTARNGSVSLISAILAQTSSSLSPSSGFRARAQSTQGGLPPSGHVALHQRTVAGLHRIEKLERQTEVRLQ